MRLAEWSPQSLMLTPGQAGGAGTISAALQNAPKYYTQLTQAKFLNPLLQQQLAQQQAQTGVMRAQAQYAPMQQLGIGQQELGAGGTALAQAKYAPQYFGGQAGQQTGLAQQELAGGQFAPAQQSALAQTMQQQAINQQIVNKYLPQVQQAQIAGTTIPVLNQVLHNLIASGLSPNMAQEAVNQLTAAARQINPNAPTTPINPTAWLPQTTNVQPAKSLGNNIMQTSTGRKFIKDKNSPGGWRLAQ